MSSVLAALKLALSNWKTTVPGIVLLATGALGYFGVSVPGIAVDPMTAIFAGVAAIFAKDATKPAA
jgi:hypothetical protein